MDYDHLLHYLRKLYRFTIFWLDCSILCIYRYIFSWRHQLLFVIKKMNRFITTHFAWLVIMQTNITYSAIYKTNSNQGLGLHQTPHLNNMCFLFFLWWLNFQPWHLCVCNKHVFFARQLLLVYLSHIDFVVLGDDKEEPWFSPTTFEYW